MDTYQTISVLIEFGVLILMLISLIIVLIETITKGKK